jgi:hypothetical protein
MARLVALSWVLLGAATAAAQPTSQPGTDSPFLPDAGSMISLPDSGPVTEALAPVPQEPEPLPPETEPPPAWPLVKSVIGLSVLLILAWLASHPKVRHRLEDRLGIRHAITSGIRPIWIVGAPSNDRHSG